MTDYSHPSMNIVVGELSSNSYNQRLNLIQQNHNYCHIYCSECCILISEKKKDELVSIVIVKFLQIKFDKRLPHKLTNDFIKVFALHTCCVSGDDIIFLTTFICFKQFTMKYSRGNFTPSGRSIIIYFFIYLHLWMINLY